MDDVYRTKSGRSARAPGSARVALLARRAVAVLTAMAEPVFQLDRGGRILFANVAGTRWHGRALSEILGKTWRELGISPEIVESLDRQRDEVYSTGSVVSGELPAAHAGEIGEVEGILSPAFAADGSVESVVLTLHGIAKRKQAEREREHAIRRERASRAEAESTAAELREIAEQLLLSRLEAQEAVEQVRAERNRLGQVVNALPVGIIIADSSQHYVIANAFAREIVGTNLVGRPVLRGHEALADVRRPDGTPYVPDEFPLQRALFQRQEVRGEQIVARSATTKQEIFILANASPLSDTNGQSIGAVVVLQDITALRELERQRNEWASIIAHDLRQPVTIIQGYTSLLAHLLEAQPRLEREREAVKHILVAATNVDRMIGDLLDVSRIEARRLKVKKRPIELPEVVRAVVERSATITSGHDVRVVVRNKVPRIEADAERVEQILGNLLSNAAKYGYANSEITVNLECHDRDVELVVINRGPGIAAADLPRLFRRFLRIPQETEEQVGGVGLGLYIAKGLVEAHGGRIWATSLPGETTEFHFTLPIQPAA